MYFIIGFLVGIIITEIYFAVLYKKIIKKMKKIEEMGKCQKAIEVPEKCQKVLIYLKEMIKENYIIRKGVQLMSSKGNKKAKEALIRLYGAECFIEKLHLRQDTEPRKYTGKAQYKRMKELSYHHILEKKNRR